MVEIANVVSMFGNCVFHLPNGTLFFSTQHLQPATVQIMEVGFIWYMSLAFWPTLWTQCFWKVSFFVFTLQQYVVWKRHNSKTQCLSYLLTMFCGSNAANHSFNNALRRIHKFARSAHMKFETGFWGAHFFDCRAFLVQFSCWCQVVPQFWEDDEPHGLPWCQLVSWCQSPHAMFKPWAKFHTCGWLSQLAPCLCWSGQILQKNMVDKIWQNHACAVEWRSSTNYRSSLGSGSPSRGWFQNGFQTFVVNVWGLPEHFGLELVFACVTVLNVQWLVGRPTSNHLWASSRLLLLYI